MKAFVSTIPFAATSDIPKKLLDDAGVEVIVNSHGRKITTAELTNDIQDADILIAGTEKITEEVFKKAPNLKIISRVGIGLDGIDFDLCEKYKIKVAYTPDAPSVAVAELCVGLMLDLARGITLANTDIKNGVWQRSMGMLIRGKTIGLMGMGRVGRTVAHLLSPFGVTILAHDAFAEAQNAPGNNGIIFVEKKELIKQSDIISISMPLNDDTRGAIAKEELRLMKSTAFLINTARGGIVNEHDLYLALQEGQIAGAAMDVFEEEPYVGELTKVKNCLLTCHIGSSTVDSRSDMEIQAVEEVVRFIHNQELKNEAPRNA